MRSLVGSHMALFEHHFQFMEDTVWQLDNPEGKKEEAPSAIRKAQKEAERKAAAKAEAERKAAAKAEAEKKALADAKLKLVCVSFSFVLQCAWFSVAHQFSDCDGISCD